jgi:hypothetical protein
LPPWAGHALHAQGYLRSSSDGDGSGHLDRVETRLAASDHRIHLPFRGLVYPGSFFTAVVLFQLVTLPVEIDASRRALALVRVEGIVSNDAEAAGARTVLTAAAMTYIAAAATAILTLLYFLMRAGLLGGSRRD